MIIRLQSFDDIIERYPNYSGKISQKNGVTYWVNGRESKLDGPSYVGSFTEYYIHDHHLDWEYSLLLIRLNAILKTYD